MIDHIDGVVKAMTLAMMILLSTTFFYRDFSYSRIVCFLSWGLGIGGLSLFRAIVVWGAAWLRQRGFDQKEVVLVGGHDEMTRILLTRLQEFKGLGYRFVGLIETRFEGKRGRETPTGDLLPTLGPFSEAISLIEARRPDIVMVTQPDLPHYPLLGLIECCDRFGISLLMVPKIYDLLIHVTDMNDLDGIPLVSLKECTQNTGYLVVKRIFDVVVSGVALLLLSPLFLLIALWIRLDSEGPVIFRQERVGQHGRIFTMFKFRTMVADAEARLKEMLDFDTLPEPVFKFENDDRVTRAGRFLRRTSLDELPQLINVLRGEMSLVGPRPEEYEIVERYNIWQRRRLKVKPGITGLQQVTNRGVPDLTERIKYDIYYIRRQSFLLDLSILLRTIFVVFSGRGAF
ncbi:MAG: sugar transferase [Deltaproteobacteria bacterium]|nr:MAG: sugar transferase [Deltaproteobacteria bacterium]